MKYGFVYLWRDSKHNRYYIGSHWGTIDDGYICSSNWMRDAYKRRPQDFKRKILTTNILERKLTRDIESVWLSLIKEEELGKKYYNFKNKAYEIWSDDEKKRIKISKSISERIIELHQNYEYKQKYLNGIKNRNTKSSELEVREKRRVSMLKTMEEKFPIDKRHTPRWEFNSTEYKENMTKSVSLKWEKLTIDEREQIGNKISESLSGKEKTGNAAKGHKKTKERNKKASDSIKEYLKLNPEKTSKGKLWWNNGLINTRNIESPGKEWIKGKLPHNKSYNSEKMKDIWAKRKAGVLPMPEYGK